MPLSVTIPTESVSPVVGGGYIPGLCSVLECIRKPHRQHLCRMHYQRLLYHGDPNAGRVRNGDPMKFLLAGLVHLRQDGPCPLWPYSKTPAGYPTLHAGSVKRMACHLVLELTGRGPRPDGMEACHSCGNGHLGCWHPLHLRWDTHDANIKEAAAKPEGLNRGERHGMSKLTADQVVGIRAATGNNVEVAALYGVSRETVRDIRLRKYWRHI